MQSPEPQTTENTGRAGQVKRWLKRLGLAGFLFFLFKGLVWIAIFVGLGKCAL